MEQEIDTVFDHTVFAHLTQFFKEQFHVVVARERKLLSVLESDEECWNYFRPKIATMAGSIQMLHSLESVYVFGANVLVEDIF